MNKSVFKSKTFYFGLLTALTPMIPAIGEFMAANVAMVSGVWGMLAIILRAATKDKLVLVE